MALAPSLEIVRQVAEGLARRYLHTYTSALEAGQAGRLRRKEVNDTLWGTISLTPIEVAVLDSPLLQRLRFLRQLGAAHWVYPGAVHTRFEHVLGALHQTDQLIKTVNSLAREVPEGPPALIDEAEAQVLRLSTLFSHVGHVCFSDCAAEELELRPEFTTLTKDFASGPGRLVPGDDPSFSQLLAYYIVLAPATRAFLSVLIKHCKPRLQLAGGNDEETTDEIIRQVSLAVIGRRIEDKRLQLHELVFGPFDANVLDELVRDAKFAGIPSVLDIRRLLQKMSVSKRPAKDLPATLAGTLNINEKDDVWLFGVRPNAISALNELQLARVLISTKIRRHPKVLAVEQMLRSVVKTIADLVSPGALLGFLYSHAEDAFVALHEELLKRELDLSPARLAEPDVNASLQAMASTLSSIRERRLWVRALQLSLQSATIDPADEDNAQGLERFRDRLGHVQHGPQLLGQVHHETVSVLTAASNRRYSAVEVATQVNARVLKPSADEARVGRALILQEGRTAQPLSDSWRSRGSWVRQYLFGEPEVYLFCPEAMANAVFIAAERLLSKTQTLLPPGCIEASKRDLRTLNTYKLGMAPDAWRGFPHRVRPTPKRLARLGETLRTLEIGLTKVSPEPAAGLDGKPQKLGQTIHNWLQQFETDDHVECAIKLIERLDVLTRNETRDALRAFFTDHPEFVGASVIPFGNLKDGSVLQAYFAEGEKGKGVGRVTTLAEWALAVDASPVVFVDDFTGSGSQAVDILAAGFGRQDLRKDLKEVREPFAEETCRQLLATKVAFLFVAAWDAGIEAVDKAAQDIGLKAVVFGHRKEADIPFARDELVKAGIDEAKVDAFLYRCSDIGEQLVRSQPREEPLDEAKVVERTLGYGNRAMLLSTLVNVPTQTLTLIWMSGDVDGNRWEALLPRRPKS